MASINPLAYRPAQIAKALVALVTSLIALLGLLASALATGGLAEAGAWVGGAAAVLTPVLVFLKKTEAVADAVDPSARLAAGAAANGGNAD